MGFPSLKQTNPWFHPKLGEVVPNIERNSNVKLGPLLQQHPLGESHQYHPSKIQASNDRAYPSSASFSGKFIRKENNFEKKIKTADKHKLTSKLSRLLSIFKM